MDSAGNAIPAPYCGPAPDPATLLARWNLDPVLLLALLVFLAAGLAVSRRRILFLAAWGGLALAFVSPLCALTTALFSARALHHLLLVSLVAPLLALGLPWRWPSPALALVGTAAALVAWHVPAVYAAAWSDTSVYWLMQGALLLPAWALWSGVLGPSRRDAGELVGHALMIGAIAGIMGLIGAVLTFASRPLYLEHLAGAPAWGLAPLADQQAAGLIMWVPGLVPLAAIAALMAREAWLRLERAA